MQFHRMLRYHVKLILFTICILIETGAAIRSDIRDCTRNVTNIDAILQMMNFCFYCECEIQGENKTCRIESERCPQLSCLIQEFEPRKCCRYCKTCYFKGKRYQDKEKWEESFNGDVVTYQCNEGVISDITPSCATVCAQPFQSNSTKCATCKGCFHEGKQISEVSPMYVTPCVYCQCWNGSTSCRKKRCPILHCSDQFVKDSECCPKCVKKKSVRNISASRPTCTLNNRKMKEKEKATMEKCTTCQCESGTVICTRHKCKKNMDCAPKDLVSLPDICCPVCKEKLSCTYMGIKRQNMEKWYLRGCVECQCVNGRNVCKKQICQKTLQCQLGYVAGYVPGSCCQQCVTDSRTCIAFGDPHYRTFDGKAYSYQGICKYTLTKDCTESSSFSIASRNNGRYSSRFSWIKTITLQYANLTVLLGQNGKVKINNKLIRIPFLFYPYIDIRKSKRYIYIYTKDNITIKWDSDTYVEVSLPKNYMNKVCGLCGNYNGDPKDDFKLPSGIEVHNEMDFGNYWRMKSSKACKRHSNHLNIPQLATCHGTKLLRAHKLCSNAFFDKSISHCKWSVPTQSYFQDCVTDVCQCEFGKQHCECGAIRSYFERCSRAHQGLKWDRKDICDSSCTGGSIYTNCGPACKQTCSSWNANEECSKPCVPGCHCPAGFVWHNEKCVPPFRCFV